MAILVDENKRIFHLQSEKTSYIFAFLTDRIPVHLYWGKRLQKTPSVEQLLAIPFRWPRSFSAVDGKTEEGDFVSCDNIPMEFSTFGNSDLRQPCFHAKYPDGSRVSCFEYKGYEIVDGKPELQGLPSTYVENDSEAQTLLVTLNDKLTGLDIVLQYSVFEKFDAITRSYKVVNNGDNRATVETLLSFSMDFQRTDFDMLQLSGAWGRERQVQRVPLMLGDVSISSRRGASSNIHNPFFALVSKNADEQKGDAYGFNLVYSGNFLAGAYCDPYNTTRVYMGINPFDFSWQLEKGEQLQSPEAILVYSGEGIGEMSRTYHRLYRNRLCKSKFKNQERSCLINNWEATYFNFNEEKIVSIAKKAAQSDIKLFVLDDGWFGKRDDDTTSLGDWFVDTNKLPNGIGGLCEKINALGMKFGLWFEPEMISPVSKLYEAHPDWCIHVTNREKTLSRNQLMLDLSRDDVCNYIIESVNSILDSANIQYVKWDYNRNMTNVGSALLESDRQGEFYHRYILGLYKVMDAITSAHPDVLFESCSGGGGRFDPGMLYYMPQAWTSDNTDALARLGIQYGTSLCYPYCTMGAHVSVVPNHQVSRTTPFDMRGYVAMPGQFGYELDVTKLSDEDFAQIKDQVAFYEKYGEVFHRGDLYRLKNPTDGNITSLEFVSEDKNTVIVMNFSMQGTANAALEYIRLQGLCPESEYRRTKNGEVWSGETLMNAGIAFLPDIDYKTRIWIFERI